jgi:holo-[acyl-carrier protein] synthase
VVKTPGGWCELELHGAARSLAQESGVGELSLSLSHEGDYVVAVVMAVIQPQRPAAFDS